MIPLTFLYDEYIDRPKFTEQKKNPFEYIVPSPTSGVGTIRTLSIFYVENCDEYPVHKIVELIRSVQIPIETHDIAACHYLIAKIKKIHKCLISVKSSALLGMV